jgi:hypothetical protein
MIKRFFLFRQMNRDAVLQSACQPAGRGFGDQVVCFLMLRPSAEPALSSEDRACRRLNTALDPH